MTPSSRASAKPIDGRSAWSSSFSNSPQMRSAGRSSSAIVEQMRGSLRIDGQLEARCKLQGTEDTEGVVCERARIDDTEDTELEVSSDRGTDRGIRR